MAKIDPLTDITLFSAVATNNDRIEAAFENTLSRDGTSPNEMGANLDMNGYRVLNLPDAVADQEPVTLAQAATIAGVENPLTRETIGSYFYPQTAVEIAAGITPSAYYYPPGELLRYGLGNAGYPRSWAGRRIYNMAEFSGNDFGAKLQNCYDYALARVMENDGLGEGIVIVVPPNPDGGWWTQTTPVDFTSGGYVTLIGAGANYIVAGAAMDYMIRAGVTNKSDRVTIEKLEFDVETYNVTNAILFGGGTRLIIRDVAFRSGGAGRFTDCIRLDRSLDPTGAGATYALLENIHSTGATPSTNSMIYADGLVGSRIQNVRIGTATTYGVYLDDTSGDVQGNTIEHIVAEAGVSTSTALVRLYCNGGAYTTSLNTIRGLVGNNVADYGVQFAGTLSGFQNNNLSVGSAGFTAAAIDSSLGLSLNLQNEYASGTFTPVWGADTSAPTIGNGTLTGWYTRYRDKLTVYIKLVAGSTTTFGTDDWYFTLPAGLQHLVSVGAIGVVSMDDNGVGYYTGTARVAAGVAPKIYCHGTAGGGIVDSATPFTWAVSDELRVQIEMRVS